MSLICNFLQTEFPKYYAIGVRDLSDEDINNPYQSHYKNNRDLMYTRLNIKFIKAYLSSCKFKSNGQMNGPDNFSKYKDSILLGSREAKEPLPRKFYVEIKSFYLHIERNNKRESTRTTR